MMLDFPKASSVSGDSVSTGTIQVQWSMIAFRPEDVSSRRILDGGGTGPHGWEPNAWPKQTDRGDRCITGVPCAVVHTTRQKNAINPEKITHRQCRTGIGVLPTGTKRH